MIRTTEALPDGRFRIRYADVGDVVYRRGGMATLSLRHCVADTLLRQVTREMMSLVNKARFDADATYEVFHSISFLARVACQLKTGVEVTHLSAEDLATLRRAVTNPDLQAILGCDVVLCARSHDPLAGAKEIEEVIGVMTS